MSYLCDDDIVTDTDINEAVASDDIIENIMDNFVTITPASGVASYSLTDDDLEMIADSMWIDFDEVSAFYYGQIARAHQCFAGGFYGIC